MPTPSYRRDSIVACLRENGPMTAKEIADMLCLPAGAVASIIASARYDFPGKHFRIAEYRQVQGRRARREVVFDASIDPDESRPVVNEVAERRKRQAEYRRRHAARLKVRERTKRSAAKGGQVVNAWAQLAAPELQTYMARIAANTNLQEAA